MVSSIIWPNNMMKFYFFKGELHLSLKIFIMFDYTFKEETYKKTVSFEKCIPFFSL